MRPEDSVMDGMPALLKEALNWLNASRRAQAVAGNCAKSCGLSPRRTGRFVAILLEKHQLHLYPLLLSSPHLRDID